ncbi:MAG: type II toxin-antitoxin system prevent-host-death family antitoxin [Bryobacteraceae bacterium]|nr:type II toxin-antitoxin system prevent-host-death family antitoxin [Bryobacteraceae bacterium]
MREIAISKFKATCLAELERVNRTKSPLRITKRGKPIAEIAPPAAVQPLKGWGSMRGTVEYLADITGPVGALDDWWAKP